MHLAIQILLTILFNSTELLEILASILFIAGTWRLLEKSGLKGWWALIPGAREYQLSRCAGREPEGRMLSVLTVLEIVFNVVMVVAAPILLATEITDDKRYC